MSQIAKAASVLLAKGSSELFMVRRAEKLRFFGGFLAFPGGKVAATDRTISVRTQESDDGAVAAERYVAAARELFEETGVLLARRSDGSFPVAGSTLQYLRRKVMAEELPFEQVLARLEATIWTSDFQHLGRVVTPPFVPTRFDTVFFLAQLPPQQQAEIWPGELDHGEWTTPEAILLRWTRGECLVSPPTVIILGAFCDQLPCSDGQPPAQASTATATSANACRLAEEAGIRLAGLFRSWEAGAIHPIFFSPQVQLIPLDTHSLPPSTHTNAYLVGHDPAYLLDPGTSAADEQERLFAVLDNFQAGGGRLSAIVLTHHHPDHVGAANVCAARYGLPIMGHASTAKALEGQIVLSRHIADGDRLDLGKAPDRSGAWYLEAIHTPGHASGHLAFYERHYRLLFAGDMVSTLSSVVIAPPDGDLAVYLASLERLRALDCRLLLPAHGSASARPAQTIDDCIAHRIKREEQLLAALGSGPRSVAELSQELYKGLAAQMMKFAELQVLAGLHKLQAEGRVQAVAQDNGEVWRRQ